MFIVFDIDGTLADPSHRLHLIQFAKNDNGEYPKQDWDAFNAGTADDTPIEPIIAVALAMQDKGHVIEFWTGRSEKTRDVTEKWLADQGLIGHALRMRHPINEERTADFILKAKWLDEVGKPDLIFEDRQSVVDMWRSHGILVAQVAEGNF